MTKGLLLLPLLALGACATTSTYPRISAPNAGVCRGEQLGRFTGRPAGGALGAEIMRVSGARQLQWIGPDEMVTMEFRADRVRVSLDANNRVKLARCG